MNAVPDHISGSLNNIWEAFIIPNYTHLLKTAQFENQTWNLFYLLYLLLFSYSCPTFSPIAHP